MSDSVLVYRAFIAAYVFLLLLHIAGLILLFKARNDLPNQRLLTKNLAVAEISFCLSKIVTFSALLYHRSFWTSLLDNFLSCFSVTVIRLSMLHIIIDRFIEIYFNIKYPLLMTSKRFLILIAANWAVSVISATIVTVLVAVTNCIELIFRVYLLLLLIFDMTILLSAITTYAHFYSRVLQIKRLEVNSMGQSKESRLNLFREKFKQPCYIVMTYICFNLTSTVLMQTYNYAEERKKWLLYISYQALMIFGLASDGIIYIFANRNVCKLLCSIFRKYNEHRSRKVGDLALQTSINVSLCRQNSFKTGTATYQL